MDDPKLLALREIVADYGRLVSLCRQYVQHPERYGSKCVAQYSELVWRCGFCLAEVGATRPPACPSCRSTAGHWRPEEHSYLVLSPQRPQGYRPSVYTPQDLLCDVSLWIGRRWGAPVLQTWELSLWDLSHREIGQRLCVSHTAVRKRLAAIREAYCSRPISG